jgi:hypothetical protein
MAAIVHNHETVLTLMLVYKLSSLKHQPPMSILCGDAPGLNIKSVFFEDPP